jgi:hypothetical protein
MFILLVARGFSFGLEFGDSVQEYEKTELPTSCFYFNRAVSLDLKTPTLQREDSRTLRMGEITAAGSSAEETAAN